ncbi:MAG: 3-phosphoshikimate 1-carboxyvinyltransferase [Candidatus Omnitrophica bacterium]|nr:3-phosphoshikimate 1-carboxyvinyltransferase [Candidatus Omnitrophota bacterium]
MKSALSLRHSGSAQGDILLPGDKSITHRFLLVSALSSATTIIKNLPANKDCLATLAVLQQLGVKASFLKKDKSEVRIRGRGLHGLRKPDGHILAGDSGTTFRLILGVLAGQDFAVRLIAGESLSRRPMLRVTEPLRRMGAIITARKTGSGQEEYSPINISGGNLRGINYKMPVASAQVKSAILLAGLYASGETRIIEPIKTRDHTERVLQLAGASVRVQGKTITIRGAKKLKLPTRLFVPGDISSASFFMVLAAILPGSKIRIKNVSLNPSRLGVINVLKRMGAKLQVLSSGHSRKLGAEPMGDVIISASKLKGTVIKKQEIPSLIDELPILMVAVSCATKKSVFEAVGELRVKETDRIRSMSYNLKKMGVKVRVVRKKNDENVVIEGAPELKGAKLKSFNDHRTAMSMVVAGLTARGKSVIDDVSCIDKSFPGFLAALNSIIK